MTTNRRSSNHGHRNRAPLANDSAIPATFRRDSANAEKRACYGC